MNISFFNHFPCKEYLLLLFSHIYKFPIIFLLKGFSNQFTFASHIFDVDGVNVFLDKIIMIIQIIEINKTKYNI